VTPNGKLVAQSAMGSSGEYIRLPGGGVDPGETIWQAAEREVLEETGKIKTGRTRDVHVAKYVWEPEFADSPTRREGMPNSKEETHVLFGVVSSTTKPTSTEGCGLVPRCSPSSASSRTQQQKSHPNLIELTTTLKCAARACEMRYQPVKSA
jgi:ADP-ribose pyrophosphatase YjhB (NUDIX family)